jgi:hypothetical protein
MTSIETIEVPWGLPGARAFARTWAARIKSDGPVEAVVLARAATETRWFQELLGLSTAVCFIRGRGPKTGEHYPLQGRIALYFGRDVEGFRSAWADRGLVKVGRWSR